MMNTIKWLLEGDVSIQYQVKRDLLNHNDFSLQSRICEEGFGRRLLDNQQSDGHWGGGYYHYKWINTHYTLLELRRLNVLPNDKILRSINIITTHFKTKDGGISTNPNNWDFSDVCVNGMNLFSFCYFGVGEERIRSVIDFIITQQLPDGGFNCNYNYEKYGAKHSSVHSTVSLIEGLNEYITNGYTYRLNELRTIRDNAIEFLLRHKLYKSDHTGEIINKKFLMLSYPPRWKYDILRALVAMVDANVPYDKRMEEALQIIVSKRRKDGTWPVQNKHAGKVHFDMEKIGGSSRWNTLRVLRVLKHFKPKHEILVEVFDTEY